MNFIGGAIPIVFYIAYFLALLLVEYIFMGKDSFVKCQNPWKNITDDEVNKICLSGMTSDKIPIREGKNLIMKKKLDRDMSNDLVFERF